MVDGLSRRLVACFIIVETHPRLQHMSFMLTVDSCHKIDFIAPKLFVVVTTRSHSMRFKCIIFFCILRYRKRWICSYQRYQNKYYHNYYTNNYHKSLALARCLDPQQYPDAAVAVQPHLYPQTPKVVSQPIGTSVQLVSQ